MRTFAMGLAVVLGLVAGVPSAVRAGGYGGFGGVQGGFGGRQVVVQRQVVVAQPVVVAAPVRQRGFTFQSSRRGLLGRQRNLFIQRSVIR